MMATAQGTTEGRTPPGPPEDAEVPWIDPGIQEHVRWRDGDIVISVPVKSGTTWTMNIVHQLREGGDPNLRDIYVEVPWLELVPAPGTTRAQRLAAFDALPPNRRRAFKTHSAPGALPFQEPGIGKDVKYVVVVRDPEEAIASMHPFIAAHSDQWFDLWEVPRDALVRERFADFFADVAQPLLAGIFEFVAAWWPLRRRPNVLMLHYSDMKRDHDGTLRTIGDFLGLHPSAERWPIVAECTSFPWMKAHEEKFEIRTLTEVPVLKPGAMVRKGRVGAASEDGVTADISAAIAEIGRSIVADEAAFEWSYRGGPLPD